MFPLLNKSQPFVKWRAESSKDERQIRAWWGEDGRYPAAGIGIDCGKSGIVVVDADRHGGPDGIAAWERMAGSEAATYTVDTPSGGRHFYYLEDHRAVISNSTGKEQTVPGVDVRGLGGYVVAPPTVDERGAYGLHQSIALRPVPVELVRSLQGRDKEPGQSVSEPVQTHSVPVAPDAFADPTRDFTITQAVDFCRPAMDELAQAPTGSINERLNTAALVLGHFVPAFWSRDEAENWLMAALETTEYDGATWKASATIESGLGSSGRSWMAVRVEPTELEAGPFAAEEAVDSWEPVDLSGVLDGTYEPPETAIGRREDGVRLLYPGKEHSVASEPESGKTWLVCRIVADTLDEGGRVVFVDFEDDEGTITSRLTALGIGSAILRDRSRFRYVRPEAPPTSTGYERLVRFGDEAATLVVLDGVTESFGLFGWDINSAADSARWRRGFVRPALGLGAATLSTDHVVKNREQRGGFAIGSQHKKAGLTGILFELLNVAPFGRGMRGMSQLLIQKDRNGALRRYGVPVAGSRATHIADLVLDATSDGLQLEGPGSVRLALYPPVEKPAAPDPADELGARIVAYLSEEGTDGTFGGKSELAEALDIPLRGMSAEKLREALERLVENEVIEWPEVGRGKPRPGRLLSVSGTHSIEENEH